MRVGCDRLGAAAAGVVEGVGLVDEREGVRLAFVALAVVLIFTPPRGGRSPRMLLLVVFDTNALTPEPLAPTL